MKKLALLALFTASLACVQIEETASTVEEAIGTTGAVLTTAPMTKTRPSSMEDRRFDQLSEIFFSTYFSLRPESATAAGIHAYDDKVGAYRKTDFQEAARSFRQIGHDLGLLQQSSLSGGRPMDWEILTSKIKGLVLDLEEIRSFEKNPDYYIQMITRGAFSISARNFAASEVRAKSLIARLRQVPSVLDAASQNLKNPPRVFTEIAIDNAAGAVQFFEKELGEAFPEGLSEETQGDLETARLAAAKALSDYKDWLENNLLSRSRGDFAIGRDNFRKKLLYEEMVDIPIETLLATGEEEIGRLTKEAKEIAAAVFPGLSLKQAFQELGKERYPADNLLEETRRGLAGIRKFCMERNIVFLPEGTEPIVRETPRFRRSLSFASMDSPGPYEKSATEAFYSVTLPPADWPEEKKEELLGFFNRYSLPIVSIHEVYPGHYTQFLWAKEAPTKIRKLLWSGANVEGWAHYAEQMLLDEGFGNGDPKLRLAQIQLALVRACRFVAAIRLHTGSMTTPDATNLFLDRACLDRANAERESRRGTADPEYLVYTLGKMMILKLRDDYREVAGEGFQLESFHNAFLSAGYPPIPIVRKLMLAGSRESIL